jgi:aminoglycoside phosphotransferase (APT) family kinase protein
MPVISGDEAIEAPGAGAAFLAGPAARTFSAESTAQTLVTACAAAGLDADGAELLRTGENAIYRLATVPMAVRIGRTVSDLTEVRTEVAVARWLESAAFPAVRLDGPADQPLAIDGRVVTFWELLAANEGYGTLAELAQLLSRLHELQPPPELALPQLRPLHRVRPRIERAALASEDHGFLVARLEQLGEAYAGLEFALPPGPVHGDATVSNILRDAGGAAVLIDLDGIAAGPPEWDLALTAMHYEHLGWHTADEYETFASIYGFDVLSWPGYRVLRDIRELIMVTSLAQNAIQSPKVAAEVHKRIDDLRGGGGHRDWSPF